MTDEKPPPTKEELDAHVLGLVKMTARTTIAIGRCVSGISGPGDARDELDGYLDTLRRFLDEIEAGILRGRINRNIRTRDGAIVDPFNVPTPERAMRESTHPCAKCGRSHTRYGACAPARLPQNEAIVRGEVRDPTLEQGADGVTWTSATPSFDAAAQAWRQAAAKAAATPSVPRPRIVTLPAPTPEDYEAQGEAPAVHAFVAGEGDGCRECGRGRSEHLR